MCDMEKESDIGKSVGDDKRAKSYNLLFLWVFYILLLIFFMGLVMGIEFGKNSGRIESDPTIGKSFD